VSISFLVNQPSSQPTQQPTSEPSSPSGQPTSRPSSPSGQPSRQPTGQPSRQPTAQPSRQPSGQPPSQPSFQPSNQPSRQPTGKPTAQPSRPPSSIPSRQPTTQPTVRISSALKNGLVAYYPFDGNTNDNSGNGYHGMIRGGVTLVADRFGIAKNAYSFDGSSGYIECPSDSQLNIVNNGTISFWINPGPVQGDWTTLFSKLNDNGGYEIVQSGSTDNTFYAVFFNLHKSHSHYNLALTPNVWNYVVAMKTKSKITFYVNAVKIGSGWVGPTNMTFTQNTNVPLRIGSSVDTKYFNGMLDDIFFFNRTLSSSEIQQLYNFDNPSGQPTSMPSFLPNRVFSYTGTIQNITVPTSARFFFVDISGAAGGLSDSGITGLPGKGARVQATIPVMGGSVLHIYVGGLGGLPTGGWNGGGDGFVSYGGGGATDIRVGGYSLANRIVVAGGGGGRYQSTDCGPQKGGDGGQVGTAGSASACFNLAGGAGGTASAGGVAGQPNVAEDHVATAGSVGFGGNGATGSGSYAGGGGGGYYGGKAFEHFQ
jgi:hypothetical protein